MGTRVCTALTLTALVVGGCADELPPPRTEDVKTVLSSGYVEINDQRQPIPVPISSRMVDRGRDLCPPKS